MTRARAEQIRAETQLPGHIAEQLAQLDDAVAPSSMRPDNEDLRPWPVRPGTEGRCLGGDLRPDRAGPWIGRAVHALI
jgi:hypothetical protein